MNILIYLCGRNTYDCYLSIIGADINIVHIKYFPNDGFIHIEEPLYNIQMLKCNIYPCILVENGYIDDTNLFPCVAFEREECIWKDL